MNKPTEDDDRIEERTMQALSALKIVTGLLARHYSVCPLCLTFHMADLTATAEAAGRIAHWDERGEDPEDDPEERDKNDVLAEDLHRLLLRVEAGTKH